LPYIFRDSATRMLVILKFPVPLRRKQEISL
jgi:hypothetical protein